MVQIDNNSRYQRNKYTIPANSIYTVDFNGNYPNYYRLNNTGSSVLYCSTSTIPQADYYNFKADGKSVANFCEPCERTKLYILNNSLSNIDIILTTWKAEFNPVFMAVSEITLSNEGTITTDGVIKGFNVSLPTGTNTIGKVELPNTISMYLSDITGYVAQEKNNSDYIKNYIDAYFNEQFTKLTASESYSNMTNLNTIRSTLNSMSSAIRNEIDVIQEKLDKVYPNLSLKYKDIPAGATTFTVDELSDSTGYILSGLFGFPAISQICFTELDGENITLYSADLNDLPIDFIQTHKFKSATLIFPDALTGAGTVMYYKSDISYTPEA